MSYSMEEIKADFGQFYDDSKEFLNAQLQWGIGQLQNVENATAEFRDGIQRQITDANVNWLTERATQYAADAQAVGDIAKQRTWETVAQSYQNFAEQIGTTGNYLADEAAASRLFSNALARELGAVPAAIDASIQGYPVNGVRFARLQESVAIRFSGA